MIDPNLHSCGSVPPHGHRELSHPEPGFYTVGVKSYGRAPTFLMADRLRAGALGRGGDRRRHGRRRTTFASSCLRRASARRRSAQARRGHPAAAGARPRRRSTPAAPPTRWQRLRRSRAAGAGSPLEDRGPGAAVARPRDLRTRDRPDLQLGIVVLPAGGAGEAHRGGHGLVAAVDRRRADHRLAHGWSYLDPSWPRHPGARRAARDDVRCTSCCRSAFWRSG